MHRDVDELFEDWLRSREEYARNISGLDEKISTRAEAIKEYALKRRSIINQSSHLSALGRSEAYIRLDREIELEWNNEKRWIATKREDIRREHAALTWPEFLRDAASKGNAAALRALRRNADRYRKAVAAAIQPGSHTDETVIRELKPETRTDGTVIYSLRDGGRVVDDGRKPVIQRDSSIARVLTLTLLAARAQNGEVAIEGDDAHALIETAAREQLKLRFRDAEHERERCRLVPIFEREDAGLAAAVFIAARNAARANQPDQPLHRLWQSADAGTSHYEGTENLGDGVQAVLLRKGTEMLVLPLAGSELTFNAAPGSTVEISAQGQVTSRKGVTR